MPRRTPTMTATGLLAAICLALPALAPATATAPGAPLASALPAFPGKNVIVVAFDGLQARHLRAYGYPKTTTPNLDQFLQRALLFRHTLSPAPWTVPAYLSAFTSRYPGEHRVVNKYVDYQAAAGEGPGTGTLAHLDRLAPGTPTLASLLAEKGYTTAAFTGDAGASAAFGTAKGFGTYFDKVVFGGFDTSVPLALEWVAQRPAGSFLLFVHGYDSHGQFAPKEGFDYRYAPKDYPGPYTGSPREQRDLREAGLAGAMPPLTADDIALWRGIYDEKIARADAWFGNLMKGLDAAGVLEESVVVVLSDHGTELLEHGRFDHGHTLYGELVEVLFAVRVPGQREARVSESLVSTLDLTPTVLGLVGVSVPDTSAMRGTDLRPALLGADVSHDVFMETDYRMYTHKRAIQTPEGWKLILTLETGEAELYDLRTDPAETTDLVYQQRTRAHALETRVRSHMADMGDTGPWSVGCLPVYADQCQEPGSRADTSPGDSSAAPPRPNLVIITIDSLRAQQMGTYGYNAGTTPFLDTMFARGTTFEQAYAPAYLTFQSDGSILSGLYPSEHNLVTFSSTLAPATPLVPATLAAAGYETAAFVSPSLWTDFGLQNAFGSYTIDQNLKNLATSRAMVLRWMDQATPPFVCFWHIYDVHLPFVAPKGSSYAGPLREPMGLLYQGQTRASIPARGTDNGRSVLQHRLAGGPVEESPGVIPWTADDIAYLRAGYDAGIRQADAELQKFFRSVAERGMEKDTIFVITSEHGEDLKEHGYVFHRDLYDVVVRVPLTIVGGPFPATRVTEPVTLLDIAPTLLALAGQPPEPRHHGTDLLARASGSQRPQPRDLFLERAPYDEAAVVRWPWKYLSRNPAMANPPVLAARLSDPFAQHIALTETYAGDELYNLDADPWERENLVGQGLAIEPELREAASRFLQRMRVARRANASLPERSFESPRKILPYP